MGIFDEEIEIRLSDGSEPEFIPIFSLEDEEKMDKEATPKSLPILPLRNTVLFPGVVIPITVGRDSSVQLIKDANKGDKIIGVVSQKDENVENPTFSDLNTTGTVAQIMKMLKMPDGNTTVILQGKKRLQLKELIQEEPYLRAEIVEFPDIKSTTSKNKIKALKASLKDSAEQIVKLSPQIPSEAAFAIKNIESLSFLVNFISSNMNSSVAEKQQLLEMVDLDARCEKVLEHLAKEMQHLEHYQKKMIT